LNVKNLLRRSSRFSFGVLSAVGTIAVLLILVALYFLLWKPNSFDASPKIVTVSRGESFSQAVDAFSSAGLLSHPALFKLSGKIFGYAGKIKTGKYSFQSGVSNREILYALAPERLLPTLQ